MNNIAFFGLVVATFGGLLLATQIPSDAIFYRDRATGEMTLDDTPKAMKQYERKVWLYRLGIVLLVVGAGMQGQASWKQA